jgi:hypothetical protein
VLADQQRVPFTLLAATVPTPAGWSARPAAYLAFGAGTCAAEISRTRSEGWRVTNVDGLHLHQVVNPGEMADAIAGAHRRLLAPRPGRPCAGRSNPDHGG